MVYKFFYKKSFTGAIKSEIISNQQLATELHKPVTRKFENWKVYSFKEYIWAADLSKYNKLSLFLLCGINIFGKHTWIVPLKDKKRYYNY